MKKTKFLWLAIVSLSLSLGACKSKPKDSELQASVSAALSAIPGAVAMVSEGVVTLSGTVADDAAKAAAEEAAKAVKGIKSVTNNILVVPPVIAEDPALVEGVNNAIKAFSGVAAEIKEGVVKLSGTIKRADLPKLMAAISALNPKSIDNQLTIQ